jgi:Domain of unknown function (DUF4410)
MNTPNRTPKVHLALVTGLAACLLAGCNTAKVTSEREVSTVPAEKPPIIYVADFGLDAQNIQQQEGVLSDRPGPLGRVSHRLYGTSADPAARAREIVDLMANSLVRDLSHAGFNASRLPPGVPMPTEGWLLQGVFTEVQEGNRLQRAMIGLGQGQTDIQVVVSMENLSKGPPKPLYEISTDASSGNKPGAAPFIALNPYAAAARFAMSGQDLNKNVRNTASQIAAEISKRAQQRKQTGQP